MRILIIANFCTAGSLRGRFTYLADMLGKAGHDVEIVTSTFSHGDKRRKTEIGETIPFSYRVKYIEEPGYSRNVSPQRLLSHRTWGKNVSRYLESLAEKPDLVYCAVPSLTAADLAGKWAKKNGVRFVADIQDLWPEAFAMVLKNKILQNLCFYPMMRKADRIYSYADRIVAVSDSYVDRGLRHDKNHRKGLDVFLGNDGETFDRGRKKYRLQKPADEFWIGYVGTLSHSYDLTTVFEAIRLSSAKLPQANIRIKIFGNGPFEEKFRSIASEKDIKADFFGRLPYEEMAGGISSCDVVVNPIVRGSAASIINKVGDYALSGLPVINTQECEEYRSLINEYKCGINCRVENAEDVAEAITRLYSDTGLRNRMGGNARRLADEKFDRRNTYRRIIEFITSE